MIATGGPFGASSSRVKPRPSAGFMPITGNRSSSRSAVKTRSGTSPPEMLRLPRSNDATCANGRARADVAVLGRRQRLDVGRVGRELGKVDADRDEPIGLRIRKRMKHEAVDAARRSGCCRRCEREREHGDRGEARPAHELPQRVADVLEERVHLGSLSGWRSRGAAAAGRAREPPGAGARAAASHVAADRGR